MRQRILTLAVVFALVTSAGAAAVAPTLAQSQGAQVTFDDQTSGGTTVTVASATLPEGGFVTIHDGSLGEGETLASVRGSSAYLTPGTHQNVTVHLDQPVTESGGLVAMPHRDTDGDRTYDFVSSNANADGPYTDSEGIVVDSGEVAASATVTFTAQNSSGDAVVVDRIELAHGGFVTAHDSSLLEGETFESVRGSSAYLSAGVHENVRIPLSEPLGADDTIIAMPHQDTNDNQAYDFVTSDGAEDGPYADRTGETVFEAGAVSVSDRSTVTFDATTTGGHTVTVDAVFVPEGGFVTIHDETLTEGATFDSVRGSSAKLAPGLHRNVRVTLDEPVTADQTLIAMPHKDTNDNDAYDFVASDGAEDGPYTDEDGTVFTGAPATISASTQIETQRADGNTVVVESVDLAEGGFVTIHDASLAGGQTFESVRGSSAYLEAGHHEDVEVTLDEPLTTSTTVYAMPHTDTNGNEEYDFLTSEGADDGPYTDGDGIVFEPAHISVLAQTTMADQETDGQTVTVATATLHNGGYVTIHDASLLDGDVFDSVRGTSAYLSPGTHENIEITVDEPVAGEETLIAMPHRETNGNQAYDFVASEGANDGPYVAAGGAVVDAATVQGPSTATVSIADQSTDGETVTVASVTMSAGGFVTIHDASLQDGATFDSVRGTSAYLEAGTHENVEVTLEDPLGETQTVIAMPHTDSNGNQAYDFVSSEGANDGPYTTAGGDIVVDSAQATIGGDGDQSMGNGPGFGFVVALVALLGGALWVSRR